jgi:GTP-binding protein
LRKVKQDVAKLERVTVQLFSSLSRLGTDEAAALIEGWLQPDAAIQQEGAQLEG